MFAIERTIRVLPLPAYWHRCCVLTSATPHLLEKVMYSPADDTVMLVAVVGVVADDVLLARHGVRLAGACAAGMPDKTHSWCCHWC